MSKYSQLPSLYRGQQLTVFGHYWGQGSATIEVNGNIRNQPIRYQTTIEFPNKDLAYPEIERLWAFATIERLSSSLNNVDESDEQFDDFGDEGTESTMRIRQSIIDIAKQYGLVTDYTTMVVTNTQSQIHPDPLVHGADQDSEQRSAVQGKNTSSQTAKRLAAEKLAREMRKSKPVAQTTRRIQNQSPRPRSSFGGGGSGGSMDIWFTIAVVLLIALRHFTYRRKQP